jgi:small subunit ribosomal protein S5
MAQQEEQQQGEQEHVVARDKKNRDFEGRPRERKPREPQEKKPGDLEEKVLFINRTSKATTGGRKFCFAALTVVGDGKGRIGFGFGKAPELQDAIRKSGEQARKRLMTFQRDGDTIPHEITVDWDGARVMLKPAAAGTGLVAGSRVRSVLALAGLKDVVGKSLRSSNPLNLVRATIRALTELQSKAEVMAMRGIQQ